MKRLIVNADDLGRTSGINLGIAEAHRATLTGLLAIVDGLKGGTTEVMCHPAHADPELLATSGYASVRERELAVLKSPELRQAVQAPGIRLISFAEL